jgi:hypothetical protein
VVSSDHHYITQEEKEHPMPILVVGIVGYVGFLAYKWATADKKKA